MSGTRFPTDTNWLLCQECHLYFAETEIDTESCEDQMCLDCIREQCATRSAYAGAEGWEE